MSSSNPLSAGSELGRRPEAVMVPVPAEGSERRSERSSWWAACCPCGRKGSESYSVADGNVEVLAGETVDEKDDSLDVRRLDLLRGRHEVNKRRHHTEDFDCGDLIVRRGNPFQVKLEFSRPLNLPADKLQLELKTGANPQLAKGTHVMLPLVEEPEGGKWGAVVVEATDGGRGLTLSISSPPKCPVGKYRLSVSTQTGKKVEEMVYVLFNPWCPDDIVYMEDEEMREEYVLNETGRIYYGTEKQIGARTWNFGQFSKGMLEACLFMLERSKMPAGGRGDAIGMARVISAMINSQDDRGVLVGNWSGVYTDGTSPTAWVGSVDILLQYHQTGEPVQFGQCWVFSGVTTTVLRCLGIPARCVTNFASAHDTDVSLTTDVYLDEEMRPLDHMNYDSIWNFHVWNDCWMARPDLPAGLGGWQAIDATPQETSCGLYCCGPASVEAIRNGMVYLKYDAPFIFAEVNSDKVFWQRQADGTFQKVLVQKKAVGHKLSTKAVGSDEREDISDFYKYSEGSEEERIAVETASRHGSRPETYADQWTASDVELEVRTEDGIIMGSDFTVTIGVGNASDQCRRLTLLTQAVVMYYTGVVKGTFKKDKQEVLLEPREVREVKLLFRYDDYLEYLVDQAAMMFTVTGRVKETGQAIVNQHNFRLRTPDLRITPLGDATVGKLMKVEITVTNPLPKTLSNVILRIEGPGLQAPRKINIGDVPRHATITITEGFVPTKPGRRKLIASLDCQQLTQVHGVTEVLVEES